MRLREKTAALFNDKAAEKNQMCKRINLTAGRRTKGSHQGCVQITSLLNMNQTTIDELDNIYIFIVVVVLKMNAEDGVVVLCI